MRRIDALREADVVVLVVDATARPGGGDEFVVDLLARAQLQPIARAEQGRPASSKPRLLPLMEHYREALAFAAIVPISALTGDGVDALEAGDPARAAGGRAALSARTT